MGGFILTLLFFLYYLIPLVYCLWLSKKEKDKLFKQVAFTPVFNLFFVIYHHTDSH